MSYINYQKLLLYEIGLHFEGYMVSIHMTALFRGQVGMEVPGKLCNWYRTDPAPL
jgi:hypothetical protein